MKPVRFAVALGMLAAMSAGAQSAPNIMKPKAAAQKAADATNAHTAAMTTLPAEQATQRGADSAKKAVEAPATQYATQTATGTTAVAPTSSMASFQREVYSYDRGGRRDPFVSLMATGDLRPVITDLKVLGIIYDENPRNSVAVLIDASTKEQYRARIGQSLGRIRVARIDPKSITFTIEEFGFSRQETLALGDPNKERAK